MGKKKKSMTMWKLCWRKLSGLKDGEVEGDEVSVG